MKAHIEFSAFHKNNKAPNIKRCLAKTETCRTLIHGLEEMSFGNQSRKFQMGRHALIQ